MVDAANNDLRMTAGRSCVRIRQRSILRCLVNARIRKRFSDNV